MLTSSSSRCAGLVETLIDCSGGTVINEEAGTARKLDALQRVLRKVPTLRTVVFCNKIETCRKVSMRVLYWVPTPCRAARHTTRRCSREAAIVAACSTTVVKHVRATRRPCNTFCLSYRWKMVCCGLSQTYSSWHIMPPSAMTGGQQTCR